MSEPLARVRWKFKMEKQGWPGVVIEGAGDPCPLSEAQSAVAFCNGVFGEGSHWCETIEVDHG